MGTPLLQAVWGGKYLEDCFAEGSPVEFLDEPGEVLDVVVGFFVLGFLDDDVQGEIVLVAFGGVAQQEVVGD